MALTSRLQTFATEMLAEEENLAGVYGLVAEDRALVWIHDPLAFRILGGKTVRGESQAAASVNLAGLGDGEYEIDWWNTSEGVTIRRDRANVRHLRHFGHGLEMKPPEFWGDIAARVVRASR